MSGALLTSVSKQLVSQRVIDYIVRRRHLGLTQDGERRRKRNSQPTTTFSKTRSFATNYLEEANLKESRDDEMMRW